MDYKIKCRRNYNYSVTQDETVFETSITVPDLSYSIRQLMSMANMPIDYAPIKSYDDEEGDYSSNFVDITEVEQAIMNVS